MGRVGMILVCEGVWCPGGGLFCACVCACVCVRLNLNNPGGEGSGSPGVPGQGQRVPKNGDLWVSGTFGAGNTLAECPDTFCQVPPPSRGVGFGALDTHQHQSEFEGEAPHPKGGRLCVEWWSLLGKLQGRGWGRVRSPGPSDLTHHFNLTLEPSQQLCCKDYVQNCHPPTLAYLPFT